jgi:hypothetical protein
MIIAWLISYSAVSIHILRDKLHSVEKWIRYVSAILFIGFGIYLGVHIFAHGHGHECGEDCGHTHCALNEETSMYE